MTTQTRVGQVNPTEPERRAAAGPDRRRRPTSPWDLLRYRRRRGPRRAEEALRPYYVDRFPRRAVAMASLLLTLSMCDAAATLILLGRGGEELNPAMRFLLGHGVWAFLLGKFALTAAGIGVVLVAQFHYLLGGLLRVGHLLTVVTAIYVLLIGYEVVLLVRS